MRPAVVPVTLAASERTILKRRPRVISEADRAAVVALACQLPADTGVPLSRWTGPELKRELEARSLVSAPVSVSSLLRFLAEDPVKPWQYQSWIFPRDPHFEAKAKVILDLYQGFYGGKPLSADDRILSFDAKPSIQARNRIHATLPAAPGRPVRVDPVAGLNRGLGVKRQDPVVGTE